MEDKSCENCVCFSVCIIVNHIQHTPRLAVKNNLNIEESIHSIRGRFYKILSESCAYYYYVEKKDE